MNSHTLRCILVAAVVLALCFSGALVYAADSRCAPLRSALEQKKHLVSEYMTALQTSYDRKELQVAELLNFKINEIKAHIAELERSLAGCPEGDAEAAIEGMEPTKSDEGKYSNKSCQDLRKILFSLVRSIHTLDKRKQSLLSNLSEEDERLLRQAVEERETVENILGTRCSETKNRRGLLQRLRR